MISRGDGILATEQRAQVEHVITVFGSSRVRPGDAGYSEAQRLGELIAEKGWVLCNGGNEGTMEAAARGAKEHGGRTIGITISMYRVGFQNVWLDQEIVAESLFHRLERLVTLGDAYVVLHGGIGTLLELALVWNLVQSPEYAQKPIFVVGESWKQVFAGLKEGLPMHRWEARSLTLVPSVQDASVQDAIRRLEAFFAPAKDRSEAPQKQVHPTG
jgi:uncharacterized protein (TIGR00730 family)